MTSDKYTPGDPMDGPHRGGTEDGPRDIMREREHPDMMVPPPTDSGTVAELALFVLGHSCRALRWGLDSRSHRTRNADGEDDSGVNMRLNPASTMTGRTRAPLASGETSGRT